jgi:threonine dehydratase
LIPIDDIRLAAERIRPHVVRTPLLPVPQLAPGYAGLRLKCESMQRAGSFKARGALNRVLTLTAEERRRGLCTVSAGNHAAAVAWAARVAGCSAVVVMPDSAPQPKIDAVRAEGAEIVFHADRATLFDRLREVQAERGATFVHPFDDPVVLAGAGTAGLEIADDVPDVHTVVVPVGGGGLLGGVASAVKALRPAARVVAVELEAGPGLAPALAAGKPVPAPRPPTLADGMTPPFVGALPLEIAREAVDEIVNVTEEEIVEGMRRLVSRARLVAEGAGAAATGAILAGKVRVPDGALVVALLSGGNVDPQKLAAVLAGGG